MKKNKINRILGFASILFAIAFIASSCETDSNVLDGIREVSFKATANKLLITEGDAITYKDSSLSVESRLWTFEGGDITASEQEEISVTYNDPSPSTGTGSNRINQGFSTNLEIMHPDGSVESNLFKVKVFKIVEPEFIADRTSDMFGSTIQFFDQTLDGQSTFDEARLDDTVFWEFEGGSPATSTERNPFVTYDTPGTYDVKLTVGRSVPESMGTTTVEDFINITLLPPCDNSVNLVDCGDNDGEGDSIVDWQALLTSGPDRTDRLSLSTERASDGNGSIKFNYNEVGSPAFSSNDLLFKEEFVVDEAGNYSTTFDVYGELMSSSNPDFVIILSYRNANAPLTHIGSTETFYRLVGGQWHNLENNKMLNPGTYFVSMRMWNPPWHQDLDANLFFDEISVVRN